MFSMNNIKKTFLILIILSFFIGNISFASNETELRGKITESNQSIDDINKEIDAYKKQLASISEDADTLSNQVKQLDLTKKKLEADIALTEKQIERDNLDLELLEQEINFTELSIKERKIVLAQNIRDVYDLSNRNLVEMLVATDTLTEAWSTIDNNLSLYRAVGENIDLLETNKVDLRTKQDKISDKIKQLQDDKSKLEDQKKIVNQNVAEKNTLLKETKNQESNYNALIAQKEAVRKAFEDELRQYESELSYILDPSKIPQRGEVVFAWPLTDVLITQLFGKTVDSARLYTSGSHSGVDFRAAVGTPVFAMANGTVVDFGDTDVACNGASFGKWILIAYDNGLATTYGHLSLIKASKGQRVTTGQTVAYSGNTGHSTGPHLHVSTYPRDAVEVVGKPSLACTGKTLVQPRAATTAYLNLLDYTPKTTPSMFK